MKTRFPSVYEFGVVDANGVSTALSAFCGYVSLIVNTASECAFTKQYAQLETIYARYRDQGFVVLAFPCNQFAAQEPADDATIRAFCSTRFGVSFPVFPKIDVNGPDAHPLYRHLTEAMPGAFGSRSIKWNFTKFLIDREGCAVKRYAPTTAPKSLTRDIEKLLARQTEA